MIKHIKISSFMGHILSEFYKLHPCCVVKSIETNQTHFIIVVEDTEGKEHKIYIPCEEE